MVKKKRAEVQMEKFVQLPEKIYQELLESLSPNHLVELNRVARTVSRPAVQEVEINVSQKLAGEKKTRKFKQAVYKPGMNGRRSTGTLGRFG